MAPDEIRKYAEEIVSPEVYGWSDSEGNGLPKSGIAQLQNDVEKALLQVYSQGIREVIMILDNYPDITVDDSVRLKNEVYALLSPPAEEEKK